MPNDPERNLFTYRLMHPRRNNLTAWQNNTFQNEITFFHDFLNRTGRYTNITDSEWNFHNYIDVESFIDYFLVTEMLKIVDAGLFSTYMYRPVGGNLVMGPLWDADLSMGNAAHHEPYYHSFLILRRAMIRHLIEDSSFSIQFVQRWQELRSSVWQDDEVLNMFDYMAEYLEEPAKRNFQRFPEIFDVNLHVWPNPEPYSESWDEELQRTREWLVLRLEWLDEHIPMLVHQSPEEINTYYQDSINTN
jgi:hypothetical protein